MRFVICINTSIKAIYHNQDHTEISPLLILAVTSAALIPSTVTSPRLLLRKNKYKVWFKSYTVPRIHFKWEALVLDIFFPSMSNTLATFLTYSKVKLPWCLTLGSNFLPFLVLL